MGSKIHEVKVSTRLRIHKQVQTKPETIFIIF